MGQRTYEANISILPAIGKAPSKKPYPPRLFLESFWNVRESVSRGTWRRSRGGQSAGVKNPAKPRAFTLVFNGCD